MAGGVGAVRSAQGGILSDEVSGTATAARSKASPLRRNFVWTLGGNLVYASSQWVALVLLVKLGSAVIVGRYTYALAVAVPVALFFNLQLRALQATDTQNQYSLGDYIGLRLGTVAAALGITAVISVAPGHSSAVAAAVLLVAVAKSFESYSDILYGLMQKNERLDLIAKSQMLRGTLSVCAVAAVLMTTHSLSLALLVVAAAWLGLAAFFDVPNARRLLRPAGDRPHLTPAWRPATMTRLGRLALPLGITSVLASLYATVPRYFVVGFKGEAALGYFAALVYFPLAGRTIVEALGQSALPRLAHYHAHAPPLYRRLVIILVALATALGVAGVLVAAVAGRQIVSVLYDPEYAGHADVLILLMIAGGIEYVASILGIAMTAARRFTGILVGLGAGVASEVVAAWTLVPRYGDLGAAWALLIGSAVWTGVAAVFAVRQGVPSAQAQVREALLASEQAAAYPGRGSEL